jgi:transcriptional regulator with XRE-family HTH domain
MNTVEPLLALVSKIPGNQGEIAKKLTMSRATLNRFINNTYKKNPRLDTLVEYSIAAYRNTGQGLAFSWDPVHGLRWSIYKKEGNKNGNN